MNTDASLYAMRLRRDNLVANYKAQRDEAEALEAIRQTERIRNAQNEYGALLEAHRRLPQGLQRPAMERLRDLADMLLKARSKAPLNFPRGAMPEAAPAAPAAAAPAAAAPKAKGAPKSAPKGAPKAKGKSRAGEPEDEPTVRDATLARRVRESMPVIEIPR